MVELSNPESDPKKKAVHDVNNVKTKRNKTAIEQYYTKWTGLGGGMVQ